MDADKKKLKEILKDGAEVELKAITAADFKTEAEKIAKASEWKARGIPVPKLADFFGVTCRTIYNWDKKNREIFVNEYENKTASELITEHLSFMDNLETMLLYELSHIGRDTLEYDPVKGCHVKTSGSLRDKRDLAALVLQIRKQKIDLEVTTGIIPKEPEKIHTSISDYRFDKDDEANVADEVKSTDEQIRVLLERLSKTVQL